MKKKLSIALALSLFSAASLPLLTSSRALAANADEVVLRVCNWEEYIDLGDWDEDETIDLESGDIIGENTMMEDFEEWYYETYGQKVRVEYSTFGTNEDLYNMLTLGDVYDVVCPSEYMIMKLMAEDMLTPLSDAFFDESDENNYYIKGVSPYIRNIFQTNEINGETWENYAAGYMWGVTGFVYNPEVLTEEEASSWKLLENEAYKCQLTVKDNVRDTYFAAIGALKHDLLTSEAFKNDPDYTEKLKAEMNDVTPEAIQAVQDYLQMVKPNLYSFETDSGKADMITGKVVANYQWSGDAVYTLDQAEEDDYYLAFAVPEESSNIYFDGWAMLDKGIREDSRKQHAAEAWINFNSRADNVIRNMYYIGYTSVIAGGDDDRIFEYADWCYGAEEDEEEEDEEEEADLEDEADNEDEDEEVVLVEYPLGYFFSDDWDDEDYILTVEEDQTRRQLFGQYPTKEVIDRTSIMIYFDQEANAAINQMWINVRCYNIKNVPVLVWILVAAGLMGVAFLIYRSKKEKIY